MRTVLRTRRAAAPGGADFPALPAVLNVHWSPEGVQSDTNLSDTRALHALRPAVRRRGPVVGLNFTELERATHQLPPTSGAAHA